MLGRNTQRLLGRVNFNDLDVRPVWPKVRLSFFSFLVAVDRFKHPKFYSLQPAGTTYPLLLFLEALVGKHSLNYFLRPEKIGGGVPFPWKF
jgi:hypothetical protein